MENFEIQKVKSLFCYYPLAGKENTITRKVPFRGVYKIVPDWVMRDIRRRYFGAIRRNALVYAKEF